MQESFYETLLQLPLFQGLSYHDLTNIVSKVKMDFRKYVSGKTIIEEGAACKDVIFLLHGDLTAKHATSDKRIIFSEKVNSPAVIGINSVFGLYQYHERTYVADSDVQILAINKQFIIRNMLVYEVCQFNFLNTLSTVIHRTNKMLWEIPSHDITKRFIQILKRNYLKPSGEKHINGKMVDIAKYLGTTRLNVSDMLNSLQEKGLVELGRKHLFIPAFQKLVISGDV